MKRRGLRGSGFGASIGVRADRGLLPQRWQFRAYYMTLFVLACVVRAAILHASWNAVLRGGSDRLWSMTLMMIAVTCVTAITLLFVPWPNAASWPYVIASAIIHAGYNYPLSEPTAPAISGRHILSPAAPRPSSSHPARRSSRTRPSMLYLALASRWFPAESFVFLSRQEDSSRLSSRWVHHRGSDRGVHRRRWNRRTAFGK